MPAIFLRSEILLFVIILIGTIILSPWKYLPKISTQGKFFLALVVAIALFFRLNQPYEHYIYYDEEYALQNARLVSESYLAPACWLGEITNGQKCTFEGINGIYKKDGYPIALGAIFAIVGPNETIAFLVNITFGILGIIVIFFLSRLLFSEFAGLASASLLAVLPEHIRWSATTNPEIMTAILLCWIILIIVLALENRKNHLLALALLYANFLALTRPEMFLILGAFLVLIFSKVKYWKNPLDNYLIILSSIAILFISTINIITTLGSRSAWETIWSHHNVESFFSLGNLGKNILEMANYQVITGNFLFAFILTMTIIGTILLVKKTPFKALLILCPIAILFLFYTTFFAGGFKVGDTVHSRFATIWLTLTVGLAGIGSAFIFEKIGGNRLLWGLSLIFLLTISFFTYFKREALLPRTNQAWSAKERQASLAFEKLNPDCLYLSFIPAREQFHGYRAISPTFANGAAEDTCVFFYQSEVCNSDFKEECERLLSSYEWEIINYQPINTWKLKSEISYDPQIPKTLPVETPSMWTYLLSRLSQ